MMAMPVPITRSGILNLLFHLLHSLSVAPDNISDMSYPIEINLQLINLAQNIMKSRNLRIGDGYRIPRSVILLLSYHLRLL